MAYQTLLVEQSRGIVTVTLNRPERLNAVIPEMMHELVQALNEVEADPAARVVVLTGAGRAFCTGADLKVAQNWLAKGAETMAREYPVGWVRLVQQGFGRIRQLPKPVIAAVNGPAMAGGCDLALTCDIRIASDRAVFGEAYIRVGTLPAGGGTFLLPRLVGTGLALEMILTGRTVAAEEAERIGLVNRVVPAEQLLPAAYALAEAIADMPPIAVGSAKSAVYEGQQLDYASALASVYETYRLTIGNGEFAEGTLAFVEKRPPAFARRPSPR
ncbi:MAG TPA: enoyl-CoA hydratase/isomerase family protein [Dehalococcoidia bacterium]|nr:enoyl-CoA hydratase/isomerase family protein [Dehalococcoidia bacterium]